MPVLPLPPYISVWDYGAKGDGVTNDTVAIQRAASVLQTAGGGMLFFPSGTYKVSLASAPFPNTLAAFSNLNGVRIVGDGAVITTPDTFSYPSNGWVLFSFEGCSNVEIRAVVTGVRAWPTTYRQGIVFCRFLAGCKNVRITARLDGIGYGIWAGDFSTDATGGSAGFDVTLDCYDVGYPVALWESGFNARLLVNAERVHRAVYIAGGRNVQADVIVKDFDGAVAGLVTGNPVGDPATAVIERGSEAIKLNVTDRGSTYQPADTADRYLVGIATQSAAGVMTHRDIDLSFRQTLTPASTPYSCGAIIANYYGPGVYNPNVALENVNIEGTIDRLLATGVIPGYVLSIGDTGTVGARLSNLRLQDILVKDNAGAIPARGIAVFSSGFGSDVVWDGVRGMLSPILLAAPIDATKKHIFRNCDTATVAAVSPGVLADFTDKVAMAAL